MQDQPVRIELFGGLRVQIAGRELTRFRTQRAAHLLAYLALCLGQEVSRDMLCELFWPHLELAAARDNLSTTLSALRRDIETHGIPRGSLLHADHLSIRLNPAIEVDTAEFERLLHEAERHELSNADRADRLEQAIALVRGDLLPDCYDDWATRDQFRLRHRLQFALHRLMVWQEAGQQWEAALHTADRILYADPCDEPACRVRMRACAALGRAAAVQETLAALAHRLRTELDVAPSPETADLAEQLRTGPPPVLPARDSAPQATYPPRAQTRAQAKAEPHAVAHTAFPAEVQSLRPEPAVRLRNLRPLPRPTTRLFGRERELTRLLDYILPSSAPSEPDALVPALLSTHTNLFPTPKPRLITLTGPGGTGKTRLAQEVSFRAAPQFGERVWFVSLADTTHPRLIPFAILHTLGIPSLAGADPLEQIGDALGCSPALLTLDNLEHLLPTNRTRAGAGDRDSATLAIRLLLERLPHLICLVTSRRLLGLMGEQEVPVMPLPTTSVPESAAVALFVDRAQAARPDFEITPGNRATVVELCRRLEGLPLAIEMAAAWTPLLPPARILEQMDHVLDLLVSRQRDRADRHRSLRELIAWSYRLLTPEQQTLFAALSIFRGGWTAETACAVCSTDEPPNLIATLDALALLREHSLITVVMDGEEVRYRFLEPIREFAGECLEKHPEQEAIRRKHTACFAALASEARPHLQGAGQKHWLNRLEQEHPNLRQALEWCLRDTGAEKEIDQDAENGLQMAIDLAWFWYFRGYLSEGERWLTHALSRQRAISAGQHARSLLLCGMFARDRGQLERAAAYYAESLALARQLEEALLIADVQHNLGLLAIDRGDFEGAECRYQEALTLFRRVGNPRGIAISLLNLGMATLYRDEPAQAWKLCQEALERYQEMENAWGIATALNVIGMAHYELGAWDKAETALGQAEAMNRELGNTRGIALTLEALGAVTMAQMQSGKALAYYREALALYQKMGNRRGIADTLFQIAQCLQESDPARALRLLAFVERVRGTVDVLIRERTRQKWERMHTRLREALSPEEAAQAEMAGQCLTWKGALQLA